MHELLENIEDGARVLDLGCGGGSFTVGSRLIFVARVDLDPPRSVPANFTRADAAQLPFASRSFDAIVANHSLEHIDRLDEALLEVARVAKANATLYVTVPDASTFSDRLYRWLARGGGHLNPFTSAETLAARIERATGLKHTATRTLIASFSFIHRSNHPGPAPRKLLLVGGGAEAPLRFGTYALRLFDRAFGTRWSVYGWALFFGDFRAKPDEQVRPNVCIRCGAGHTAGWLRASGNIRGRLFPQYSCPACGTRNYFSNEG